MEQLAAWLHSRGAELHGVEPAQLDGFGLSIVAPRGLPGGTAALAIPGALALTAGAAQRDPDVARALERAAPGSSHRAALAVVLGLARQRHLGSASAWDGYIAALPPSVPTLLHAECGEDGERRLAEVLAPTPLGAAIASERAALRARLARVSAATAGAPWGSPADLLWAHAMFSSRAMLVPAGTGARPGEEAPPPAAAGRAAGGGFGAGGAGRHALGGRPAGQPTHEPAMVPLHDLCNHRAGSTARFELRRGGSGLGAAPTPGDGRVAGAGGGAPRVAPGGSHSDMFDCMPALGGDGSAQGGDAAAGAGAAPARKRPRGGTALPPPAAMDGTDGTCPPPASLVLRAGAPVAPGGQLLISYGDKTNCELAAHYGFVVPGNPADAVDVLLLRAGAGAPPAAQGGHGRELEGGGARPPLCWRLVLAGSAGSPAPAAARRFRLMPGTLSPELVEAALQAEGAAPLPTAASSSGEGPSAGAAALLLLDELAGTAARFGDDAVGAARVALAGELVRLAATLGDHPGGDASTGGAVAPVIAVVWDLRRALAVTFTGLAGLYYRGSSEEARAR